MTVLAFTPFGLELPASALVLGMITGLTYGLLSAGLVIVYRTNRIINFAHGEVGAFGAALFGLAAARWGVPYYLALPVALAAGAGTAGIAEVAVVRRLRNAPRLMSVVATLGVAQFLVALSLAINTQAGAGFIFPEPPGLPELNVGALLVRPSYVGILVFAPIVVIGLAAFLRRSRFGLALRGAAANPEAARLAGVSSSRMSSLAWAIAGALSTFTAILVLPTTGLATGASFGPGLLLRALVGAVIARMSSLPGALGAGLVLGVVEGVLLRNYPRGGAVELVLFGIILVALLVQHREAGRDQERGSAWASVMPWRPLPEAALRLPTIRFLAPALLVLTVGFLALLPAFITNNVAITVASIVAFASVALSVGVVTGLGGQLTLGQFAIAGVGAAASYHVASRTGVNPILALVYAGVAGALASLVIGLPALRIRGLFLTVTTLGFAVVVPSWLLQQPWALGDGVDPGRPNVFGETLDTGRSYYYFVLVVFVLMFLLARNVWTSGLRRLLVSIRDNEDNARAFTLPARRIKIQGFLLGGFIAGVGGAAYAHMFSSVSSSAFLTQYSIDVVVMTVVGGVGLLAGPVLGAAFALGVPAFVPLDSAGLAATRLGLLFVILYAPGGIAQVAAPLRARVVSWLVARSGTSLEEMEAESEAEGVQGIRLSDLSWKLPAVPRREDPLPRLRPLLQATEVRKRYGGIVAVDGVSLTVREGETVGLIGPNGAGKTTLFETLGGFTRPDSGAVHFDGADVTRMTPEGRGRLGLIRSFQDAGLFPTMTVLDTVKLSMERTLPTQVLPALLGARGVDRAQEAAARELIGSMGLWSYRNKQVQELSTGTRRITELACLVALRPRLLLLDEPSSGIAQRETEALGSLLEALRDNLGITLVVIEHDIPLIMGLADRIIAMDAGKVIADGSPDHVRHDPLVVEAYLGGRAEAIERSGMVAAGANASAAAPPPAPETVDAKGESWASSSRS